MKILLVRPRPHPDSIGIHRFMISEPLEFEYLVAAIADLNHEVEILDMILESAPLTEHLKRTQPDLVGFTAYISHVGVVLNYAREVKAIRPSCVTVVGGVHAEVNPQDFLSESIDFIMKANAVQAFRELVERLGRGENPEAKDIAGAWIGPQAQYVIDWDYQLPLPDRQATAKYRKDYNYIFHDQCATLKTSNGCAFDCDFCYCIQITGKHLHERDLDSVMVELKTIPEKNVFIVDDNFLYRSKRVARFIELLREHEIDKNYILFGRSDFIVSHPELMRDFHAVGLSAVFVGIESFEEQALSKLKRGINVDMNVKTMTLLQEIGIECYSGIIVNSDWSEAQFRHLSSWLNRFNWPIVNIQPLTPIPGTTLYEREKDKIVVARENYELWDMAHVLIPPKHMSVRRFYWNIMRSYATSSVGPKAHLALIRKYGLRVYWRVIRGVIFIAAQYLKMALSAKLPTAERS